MDVLHILAIAALFVGVVVALSQKAWPVALLCAGLILALLSDAGIIRI